MLTKLTPAIRADIDFVYELQNIDGVRQYFRTPEVPSFEEHKEWMLNTITSEARFLYIISIDNERVGTIRVDLLSSTCVEVSIIINPRYHGRSAGYAAVNLIKELYSESEIKAYIHEDNTASKKLFIKAGFEKIDSNNYLLKR